MYSHNGRFRNSTVCSHDFVAYPWASCISATAVVNTNCLIYQSTFNADQSLDEGNIVYMGPDISRAATGVYYLETDGDSKK